MAEAEKTKNLCAQIPESLHIKVRQRQEKSGQSLSAYMTDLIKKFFEMEGKDMKSTAKRPVAFLVSAELFAELKEYLKRHNMTQVDFFVNCIQRALEEEKQGENT